MRIGVNSLFCSPILPENSFPGRWVGIISLQNTMSEPSLIRQLLNYSNLDSEVDEFDKIHATIEKDIVFKGTNLWILIFAIIVASVGLNMNSTAVIIGAMLISPLMGPINGIGYSIATYNMALFRKAIKNFGFAVGASLVASTLYFVISPVSTAHSELLARTSPTIYDVLIALFGGLAGIVAISSKQKGNVIPGVAIATALMPPLCTAGYGLATWQLTYFLGAFYLFTINTVFIAIATLIICQVLKFPIRTIVDPAQRQKINRWISFVITITILPSLYFGYGLVKNEQFMENASRFVNNVNVFEGNYLLKNQINAQAKTIELTYGGATMDEMQKERIREKARDFAISKEQIILQQGLSFDALNEKNSEVNSLKAEINRLNQLLTEAGQRQDSVKQQIALEHRLLSEIKTLFPEISTGSYSNGTTLLDSSKVVEGNHFLILETAQKNLKEEDKQRINRWLKTRINSEKVIVIYRTI
mgnify:CR=1 FL=1